jgi:CO/xanthine dehydrogenase FAD-binding subunit
MMPDGRSRLAGPVTVYRLRFFGTCHQEPGEPAADAEVTRLYWQPELRSDAEAFGVFVGPLETSLGDDEMVLAVDFPTPTRWGFTEWARRHGDCGLVTVVAAEVGGSFRIAIGGVGSVPVRPHDAEAILSGGPLNPQCLADAAKAAAEAVTA